MPAHPFEAVLFDLDGVLLDSEVLANTVWVALLAQHGLSIGQAEFMARAVGSTHRDLFAWLAAKHAWTAPEGFVEELDRRLLEAFEDTPSIEGARDTLLRLGAAGLPFAVASNSQRGRLHKKLRAAGLADLVGQHAYCPADVGGRGKPEPDLYQHAAGCLGARVERCLVVEDSVTGASAGLRAGATVWGLLAGGHLHPDSANELRAAGVTRLLGSHADLQQALGLAASVAVTAHS